jgi:hypothetical protein
MHALGQHRLVARHSLDHHRNRHDIWTIRYFLLLD